MSEEEKAFQDKLDEEGYEARDTRLVFADWLEERNDPRAEGYRVLALQGIYPNHYNSEKPYTRTWRLLVPGQAPVGRHAVGRRMPHQIPAVVFNRLPQPYKRDGDPDYKTYASRRLAEDAFCAVLVTLTPKQREKIRKMHVREYWGPGVRDED